MHYYFIGIPVLAVMAVALVKFASVCLRLERMRARDRVLGRPW